MYCPKCKQSFEEGSRRFCPTDGARLIAEGGKAPGKMGVFANLIPKMDGLTELSNKANGAAGDTAGQMEPSLEEAYFELDVLSDDDENEIYARSEAIFRPMDGGQGRAARKVHPNEIPAGHVDVEDGYKPPVLFTEFNENDPDSFVGKTVKGRYVATEFLGGDASGLAFVADDKIHADKKVLVRILLGEEGDEDMETMLAEERVSLSHFTHPNVARLIDSGAFADGTKFLISEFVDALSAADILSIHGAFAPHRAARIIRQLASALSEAHQEGIIHRDLRPENVIIDASDGDGEQTKLVNFGASSGEPNKVNFLYRAPEVLEGRASTAASDIYSLGVVAFEMLTGRLPFAGATERELLKKIASNNRLLAHATEERLPEWVDGILARAIAPAPGERYAKARELGDALLSALPEPVAEEPNKQPVRDDVELELDAPLPRGRSVAVPAGMLTVEPAWKARSPEPPAVEDPRAKWLAAPASDC